MTTDETKNQTPPTEAELAAWESEASRGHALGYDSIYGRGSAERQARLIAAHRAARTGLAKMDCRTNDGWCAPDLECEVNSVPWCQYHMQQDESAAAKTRERLWQGKANVQDEENRGLRTENKTLCEALERIKNLKIGMMGEARVIAVAALLARQPALESHDVALEDCPSAHCVETNIHLDQRPAEGEAVPPPPCTCDVDDDAKWDFHNRTCPRGGAEEPWPEADSAEEDS